MSEKCAFCKALATKSCSACNKIFYCSKEHQKSDWKRHKSHCIPFKIKRNDILGRYVVATRNIEQGEVIIRKNPLILGPKMATYPLCLGCHKRLKGYLYFCKSCKWPLCGEPCESSTWHQNECVIFTKSAFRPDFVVGSTKQPVYSTIVPLRALLLKSDQEKFDLLSQCRSHLNEHKSTPVYQILKRNLVPLFINRFKLKTTEEEILKICSILDTNTFEVRNSTNDINIRGLYPVVSLLAHNCRQNTKHHFEGVNQQLILTATVPIKKNQLITVTYTQTLWGTLMRRQHLRNTKYFDCTCLRCSDPTEFGTYCGSVYCKNCKHSGVKSKLISIDPLEDAADWKCENCANLVPAKEILQQSNILKLEIAGLDKTHPGFLEEFLVKYQEELPPTNWLFLQVKYALTQMYGNMDGFELQSLPVELLDRKIELCRELLAIADILEPGWSRFRGCLLYDLHTAMKVKVNFDNNLENSGILEEARKILNNEPDFREKFK